MRRRARGLCVTKRMIITKAKELDEEIGHLIRIDGGSILGSTDCGVEKWWLRFAKRNNLSKRVTQKRAHTFSSRCVPGNITSSRRRMDNPVISCHRYFSIKFISLSRVSENVTSNRRRMNVSFLVDWYRANIHTVVKNNQFAWIANADETAVPLDTGFFNSCYLILIRLSNAVLEASWDESHSSPLVPPLSSLVVLFVSGYHKSPGSNLWRPKQSTSGARTAWSS